MATAKITAKYHRKTFKTTKRNISNELYVVLCKRKIVKNKTQNILMFALQLIHTSFHPLFAYVSISSWLTFSITIHHLPFASYSSSSSYDTTVVCSSFILRIFVKNLVGFRFVLFFHLLAKLHWIAWINVTNLWHPDTPFCTFCECWNSFCVFGLHSFAVFRFLFFFRSFSFVYERNIFIGFLFNISVFASVKKTIEINKTSHTICTFNTTTKLTMYIYFHLLI